jgi:predicted DNA-binding protein
MDIMRNTLGVGPCQYVLDSEGLSGGEAATPAFVMEWVEKQLKKKKADVDEVRERLKNMTAHVGRTHARIQKYADFAEEVQGRLAHGWSAVPPSNEEVAATEKLRATAADMKASAATGLAATEADKVTKPADEIAGLVGKDDAVAKAAGSVAEVRAVGAAEDRALAKCRMATRWLRCQCLDIAEGDVAKKAPALVEVAKKIEARAREMLQGK